MELRLFLFQWKIFFVKLKYIQLFGYIPSMDWCGFRELSYIGFQFTLCHNCFDGPLFFGAIWIRVLALLIGF